MRKPRDFDAELQALTDKAKALKAKKQGQLGELVITTGADALSIEQLAGALIDAAGSDAARKEAWRKSGAAFFRGDGARTGKGAGRNAGSASAVGSTSSFWRKWRIAIRRYSARLRFTSPRASRSTAVAG